MATKKTNSSRTAPPTLVMTRNDAKERIRNRIAEGRRLAEGGAEATEEGWHSYNRELIGRMFSDGVSYLREYAVQYNRVEGRFSTGWDGQPVGPTIAQRVKPYCEWLEALIPRLDLIPESSTSGNENNVAKLEAQPGGNSDTVFIVHGHDDLAKTEVARFIERTGLRATILHEQPNGGRTIIEKFEAYGGAAGFAIIVATQDDVASLRIDSSGSAAPARQYRARQNVIAEMGWFAGRLGRNRSLRPGERQC